MITAAAGTGCIDIGNYRIDADGVGTISTDFENASNIISSLNNGVLSVVPNNKMTLKEYTFYVIADRTGSPPFLSTIADSGLTQADYTFKLTITCGTWTNIPASSP